MKRLAKFKPGVSRSIHLFLAPFFWSVAGSVLMIRGLSWFGGRPDFLVIVLFLALGSLKSYFILDKSIARSIHRIENLREGSCIGAVYSWKMWVFIAMMMLLGVVLRHVMQPGAVVGFIYAAVGFSLICSSRIGWITWLRKVFS